MKFRDVIVVVILVVLVAIFIFVDGVLRTSKGGQQLLHPTSTH